MVSLMLVFTLLYCSVRLFIVVFTAVWALAIVPVLVFRNPLFRLLMLVITPVVLPSPTIMVCTAFGLLVNAALSLVLSTSSLPVSGSVVIPILCNELTEPEPETPVIADFRRVWMVRSALSPSNAPLVLSAVSVFVAVAVNLVRLENVSCNLLYASTKVWIAVEAVEVSFATVSVAAVVVVPVRFNVIPSCASLMVLL